MNEIPTVRIKADTPLGYAIINESDFDSSEHELFDENPADAESTDELDDLDAREEMTATTVTEENPDQPRSEPKSCKRRQSVET